MNEETGRLGLGGFETYGKNLRSFLKLSENQKLTYYKHSQRKVRGGWRWA